MQTAIQPTSKTRIKSKINSKIIISELAFGLLISKVVCDTGNNDDVIGFTAKFENYEVRFHVKSDDYNALQIDDFGFTINNKWMVCLPTASQKEILKGIINNKLNELDQLDFDTLEGSKEANAINDTESFINANFYKNY